MKSSQFKAVGIGECLWDDFPSGRQPGGAPANFAYIAGQLGDRGIIASRVGDDADGRELVQQLERRGIDTSRIQIDDSHHTGIVSVELDGGQPRYVITENVAWDNLEMSSEWRSMAAECDAVCFGSLAQRTESSRKAIKEFVSLTPKSAKRVFDANLRQSYYSEAVLIDSLRLANIVKLNEDELDVVTEATGIGGSGQQVRAEILRDEFEIDIVCITRGANGSFLIAANGCSDNPGLATELCDAVGAGDAFTAAMIHGVLRSWDLNTINQYANRVAALVASRRGAMPEISIGMAF